MQLTKYTDNSLRVLMYLALKPNELGTIEEIAEKFEMSRNHLMKVVNRLSVLGYVTTIKGRGGGMKLAKPAEEITVGMVVRDMESTLDLIDCETKPCPILSACKLKGAVNLATDAFLSVLDQHTIASLVKSRSVLLTLVS